MMFGTDFSRSASGITMMKFLAPPPHCTRFPCCAASAYTAFAVGVEVTEEMPATPGCVINCSDTVRSPLTRLSTPGGKPASSISSKRRCEVTGTSSEGFSIAALPQATAYGQNQDGTMAGKLNGGITAQTPARTHSPAPSRRPPPPPLPERGLSRPHHRVHLRRRGYGHPRDGGRFGGVLDVQQDGRFRRLPAASDVVAQYGFAHVWPLSRRSQ